MRLALHFSTRHNKIPLDYRPLIMSYIKGNLSSMYDDVYRKNYSKDNLKSKAFTFCVLFPKCRFEKNSIEMEKNNFTVILSSHDHSLIVYIYNSLLPKIKKEKEIALKNSILLRRLYLEPETEVKNNQIYIKFLSPLLVRVRENYEDTYIDYTHPEFNKKINIVVENFISAQGIQDVQNKKIDLTPIKAKRTVIKNMKLNFNVSLGEFLLKGEPKLLNYLLQSGIGSRRGQGFGMFKVIDKPMNLNN